MGAELVATVSAPDSSSAARALSAAFRAVRLADDLLSTWRTDAALARVNRAPAGRPVALDPELARWLGAAWPWVGRTGAAFDPTIGALVNAWDLRGAGRVPDAVTLQRALRATGTDLFTLTWTAVTAEDAERHRGTEAQRQGGTCLCASVPPCPCAVSAFSAVTAVALERATIARHDSLAWIDSGAFGKGAALSAAVDSLWAAGIADAFLNFGGQIVALGRSPAGTVWTIGVAHPVHRELPVATVRLSNQSAATTAQSVRFVEAAGDTIGHVLDPRTGRPVPPWGSVTVVHRDPLVADILSTALFVMGPDEGLAWLEGREDVAALFVIRRPERLEARWNAPMDSLLMERSW